MAVGKLLNNMVILHNKALQPTANPLRGLPAAELNRYVAKQKLTKGEKHAIRRFNSYLHR